MTDAVKLLTEAEARELYTIAGTNAFISRLRERGLIAEEPVDPLLIEARNVVGDYAVRTKGYEVYEAPYRQGKRDSDSEVQIALAALKRGMEMRAPLTREMVHQKLWDAFKEGGAEDMDRSDFGIERDYCTNNANALIDALHAALTQEQS